MAVVDAGVLVRRPLLRSAEGDRYFDYCLEPYRPRRPWQGKARSENLLWNSLDVAGARGALEAPLRAIQDHVGRDLTVWGAKWDGRTLFWELYFYDPQKESAEATVTSITEAVAPFFRIAPAIPETIPYMMVSFDLGGDTMERGVVPEVNLYLAGEKHHAGRSYKVRASGMELENTYRFMAPKREVDELLPLLQSSAFVDYSDPRTLSKVLIPELFACKKVCVAKKRLRDGIYYSGIAVDQLLFFLRRFGYPAPIVAFVERNQESFEHLYFDVGIDYEQRSDGSIVYPKTSYYGTL
jgi:hypothetical protein